MSPLVITSEQAWPLGSGDRHARGPEADGWSALCSAVERGESADALGTALRRALDEVAADGRPQGDPSPSDAPRLLERASWDLAEQLNATFSRDASAALAREELADLDQQARASLGEGASVVLRAVMTDVVSMFAYPALEGGLADDRPTGGEAQPCGLAALLTGGDTDLGDCLLLAARLRALVGRVSAERFPGPLEP
jgi:hypothetical protein